MSYAIETPTSLAAPATQSAVAVRCDCCGSKKAAALHPQRGLTIRFGHGAGGKHQVPVSPRRLLQLLSGTDTPAKMLDYVRRLLSEDGRGHNEVTSKPPDC